MKIVCMMVALLTGICTVTGQDWISLDDWVKAQGLTPTIAGGTSGTHYHWDYPPRKAFDGVTYSGSYWDRWLGSIQRGAYLQYSLPAALTAKFTVQGYRLHTSSSGSDSYYKARAPRSWALYGHMNEAAAASDAGWVLIDEQADVQWPFETGGYDSSVPATQYVLDFTLNTPATYRAYKFVPLSSNRPASSDTWTTGLMELVFLGNESVSGDVTVQGAPGNLCEVSPAYGEYANLAVGTNITFTAPVTGYADNIRYRCTGYVLETRNSDGVWVMDGTNLNATAYTYPGDGSTQRLTWLWEEDGYTLTTAPGVEGDGSITVSPEPESDGYYTKGTQVTLTPVVPEGAATTFKKWFGDVPADARTDSPLLLTMDANKSVYAHFRRPWSIVTNTTYQITDGNWTLRLCVLEDGTCGVGVDSTYRAPLAGAGFLDLTAVEEDTGLQLTRVMDYAFTSNTDITGLFLPESLKYIGYQSFYLCSELRFVELSSGHLSIAGSAFRENTALLSVEPFLPDTIAYIGDNAFEHCRNLVGDLKLSSPALTTLHTSPFGVCSKIGSVDMRGSGITSIGRYAFQFNVSLKQVMFPETLQTIDTHAFQQCTNLTHAVFSSDMQSIGNSAFQNCTKLVELDFSKGLRTIGGYAFQYCTSLTNLVLSETLESIGTNAFIRNIALKTVTPFLPGSVTNISASAFNYCTNLTGALRLSNPALKTVGNAAFDHCAFGSVDMSESGITSLATYVFNSSTRGSLTNVVLSPVLQTIGNYAFGWNSGLQTVTPFLPESVTSIGTHAFVQCKKLTGHLEITNPDFTSIGQLAFQDAPLTQVTLPDADFTIGNQAFQNGTPSLPVYFLGRAPASIGSAVFRSTNAEYPFVLNVCRQLDPEGWAAYTTALTDDDRAKDSFPGRPAFGVYVDGTHRNWMVHWNSPVSRNPGLIYFR